MARDVKVTIVNKSASVATVTYTNWTALTSRSVTVKPGSSFVTYNTWELDPSDGTTKVATTENALNLPVYDPNLTLCLITDFGFDKERVSVAITSV